MKKRITIAVAIALILAAAISLILWSSSRKPMPVYQGKTAERWLEEIYTTNQPAVMAAFREMGTNAFPVLLDVLRKNDSAWSRLYARIYRKLPVSWQQHLTRPVATPVLWSGAAWVVMSNRGNGRTALPELARVLEDKSLGSRSEVISAFSFLVGPKDTQCVPALVTCLEDTNAMLRFEAIHGLQRIGPGAGQAVPALTKELASSNVEERVAAAWALWNITHEPNASVPVLRGALTLKLASKPTSLMPVYNAKHWALIYLHEINPQDVSLIPDLIGELQSPASGDAARILGNYGKAASSAVPALTNLVNSPDITLRRLALETLKKIDPETAGQYERK